MTQAVELAARAAVDLVTTINATASTAWLPTRPSERIDEAMRAILPPISTAESWDSAAARLARSRS